MVDELVLHKNNARVSMRETNSTRAEDTQPSPRFKIIT